MTSSLHSRRAAVAEHIPSLTWVQEAVAGCWHAPRVLEGSFATSSPPDAPLVAGTSAGHAIAVWSARSGARYADKAVGKGWGISKAVPGGNKSAGFVALGINDRDVTAVAYLTAATKYLPSKLNVCVRSATGVFGAPVTVARTRVAFDLRVAVAPDGGITVLWTEGGAVHAAHQPVGARWTTLQLSSGVAPAWLPDLATNESGQVLVVWQEGPGYQPTAIYAARMAADGTWGVPEKISPANGRATWNPKPGLAAAGDAAVAWLEGHTMVVARGAADGTWQVPEAISGSQSVHYPALSMDGSGGLMAAWQALDAFQVGSIWSRMSAAGGSWRAPVRLSKVGEDAAWPTASCARTGGLAVVGWTDNAAIMAMASVARAGTWKESILGDGWWMGVVPVATSSNGAAAAWARPHALDPNAVDLLAAEWR